MRLSIATTVTLGLAVAAAGCGLRAAAASGVPATVTAAAHVSASHVVATGASPAGSAAGVAATAAAQPSQPDTIPCMGSDPSCCGGPLGGADGSCGQPLLDDPTGDNRFEVNDCSSATDVAIGTVCATTQDPLGIAVAPTGAANGGEVGVSVIGPAGACGGPEPVAVSPVGTSTTCKGDVPAPGAHTGFMSVNGG